ncbi:hypothetical protein BDN71DRAFT_1434343 [Pleurotus eryngii]|uniref:DUF7330 domain-containing protein n=1 Tax=Pleurotus eryngii TaxID=5323 RepID=A0A9P6DD26_PLEER|nr:hypothetical protein BDN71DRAFT_1434343 [Pleurotus eryngii]
MDAGEDNKGAPDDPTKIDDPARDADPPLPPYSRSHPIVSSRHLLEESVNWLSVSRENESISGTYTVDRRLDIPAALLTLPSNNGRSRGDKETERVNLGLETKEGDIDVTVRIVGENGNVDGLAGSAAEIERKVKIKMRSSKGSITCRIVPVDEPTDLSQGVTRPRFIAYASADNGSVNVLLPRSFSGSISAFAGLSPSPRGPIELSPDLRRNARILMDTDRKRFFVGDFTQFDKHSSWDADVAIPWNHSGKQLRQRGLLYILVTLCQGFAEAEVDNAPRADEEPLVDKEVTEPVVDEEPRVVAMEVRETMADEDEGPTMEDDEGIPVNDEGTGTAEDEPIADDEALIVDRDVTEPSPEEEPMADEGFAVEEAPIIDVDDVSIDKEIAEVIDAADVTDDVLVPTLESGSGNEFDRHQRANHSMYLNVEIHNCVPLM